MNDTITSEPAKSSTKSKKRKMSAEQRKALSDAAKERWATRKSVPTSTGSSGTAATVTIVPQAPPAPLPPSPAVLQLQEQVVTLVAQRGEARSRLTQYHGEYLLAQSRFQAAEAELKGIEAEVQYRIGLIAQLENRPAPAYAQTTVGYPMGVPSLSGVSSEPAQPAQTQQFQPQTVGGRPVAVGSADDLRRQFTGGMM